MNASDRLAGRRKLYYIALIVLLLLVNAFLLYNNLHSKTENENLIRENTSLVKEKNKLLGEMDSLMADLETQRGDNELLNAQIDKMEHSLDSLKEVYTMRLSNKNAEISQMRAELNRARAEFEKTKKLYEQEIADLQNQVEELQTENESLQQEIVTQKKYSRELEDLVDKGQVLSVGSITANAVRIRNNKWEATVNSAKKAEKIKICFTFNENRIAQPGPQEVLVRIVSPEGSTLAVESLGSGTFTLAESGEHSLYTMGSTVDYDPSDPVPHCLYWQQDQPYMPGTYTIEVYHKGYLVGSTQLTLKKGLL